MKKCLIVVFCVCLLLTSCGQNKIVEVQNAISDIGNVNLGSEQAIENAEKLFSQLTPEQQKRIDTKILDRARTIFDNLEHQKNIVEEKINLITDETFENVEIIENAKKEYYNLSSENQKYVSNADVLINAINNQSQIKTEEIINMINQIGTVTLSSEQQINTIYNLYNELSNEYKQKVTNYNILETAKKQLETLKMEQENLIKQQTKQNALSQFYSKYDKVNDVMFYFPSVYPEYINTRSYILPYLSVNQYSANIRLQINYTGDNWVFFDNITIWIDGENYYKSFGYSDVVRDNQYGDVWEYVDFAIIGENTDYISILQKIANSNETIVRFQGRERSYDLTVSTSDKNAINQILTAYDTIKSL